MAEAEKPEDKSAGKESGEKSFLGANSLLIAGAAIMVFAAAALFYLQGQGNEISPSEFNLILNATEKIAVVQDLRSVPEEDFDARRNLQQCGIDLSYALSLKGKNVSNYAFEGDSCFAAEGSNVSQSTVEECNSRIARNQRLTFTLKFNPDENKTLLTAGGAEYHGDAGFLGECSVTGLAR